MSEILCTFALAKVLHGRPIRKETATKLLKIYLYHVLPK